MKNKKIIGLMVMAFLLASGNSFMAYADNAHFSGASNARAGFSGPGPQIMTMTQAAQQADDTWLTLKGNIIHEHGDEKYLFRDASGQGIVEIDHDTWGGQHITPTDTVELVTKVDKDWNNVEFEVESIRKVQ